MTKRSYSVLQKRLQKLESELSLAFSFPLQTSQDHHQISQYIQQRFAFLRKLLSAEIASHPKKPYQLHSITRRLKELETAFSQWDNSYSKSLALDDHLESFVNDDDGDASPPELPEKFYENLAEEKVNNMDDESWPNAGHDEDGAIELGSPGFEEAKKFFEGLSDEKVVHGVEEVAESQSDMKIEEQRVRVGKYGRSVAVAAWLVLGSAMIGLAIVRFSGYFHYVEHNSLLKPT